MKYKVIHNDTETLCDKFTINGFDYYIGDIVTDIETPNVWHTNCSKFHPFLKFIGNTFYAVEEFKKGNFKKVIATNNPRIDLPKVVDEVERLKFVYNEGDNKDVFTTGVLTGIEIGYNKSQETHPFSMEDVKFMLSEAFKASQEGYQITSDEIIELWQSQRTVTIHTV